jgi:Fe2+ transport system protein FeoA
MTTVCALCGFRFEPGGASCAERGCPWAVGRCAILDCPRCGYAVPDERASTIARWIRRWLGGRAAAPAESTTLADLRSGDEGVVEAVQGEAALVARLTAQGLVPGVSLRLVQRTPSYVIELGETTLAVERRVAEAIRVQAGRPPAITRSISSVNTSTSSRVV